MRRRLQWSASGQGCCGARVQAQDPGMRWWSTRLGILRRICCFSLLVVSCAKGRRLSSLHTPTLNSGACSSACCVVATESAAACFEKRWEIAWAPAPLLCQHGHAGLTQQFRNRGFPGHCETNGYSGEPASTLSAPGHPGPRLAGACPAQDAAAAAAHVHAGGAARPAAPSRAKGEQNASLRVRGKVCRAGCAGVQSILSAACHAAPLVALAGPTPSGHAPAGCRCSRHPAGGGPAGCQPRRR